MKTFRQFITEKDYDYDFENDPEHVFFGDPNMTGNGPQGPWKKFKSFGSFVKDKEQKQSRNGTAPTEIYSKSQSQQDTQLTTRVQDIDNRLKRVERMLLTRA